MIDPVSLEYSLPYYIFAFAVGYLAGSIPFGLVFTRLAGLGDIRSIGSGNIGATNVLRTGNRPVALATLIADAAKGGLVVLVMRDFYGNDIALIAGVAAFIGHVFPVWLRFQGGKGVATFLGLMLALFWPVGLLCCATWLLVAALSRFSSLSALLSAAASPLYLWAFNEVQIAQASVLLAAIIFYRHKDNIQRLIAGQEPKIGAPK